MALVVVALGACGSSGGSDAAGKTDDAKTTTTAKSTGDDDSATTAADEPTTTTNILISTDGLCGSLDHDLVVETLGGEPEAATSEPTADADSCTWITGAQDPSKLASLLVTVTTYPDVDTAGAAANNTQLANGLVKVDPPEGFDVAVAKTFEGAGAAPPSAHLLVINKDDLKTVEVYIVGQSATAEQAEKVLGAIG